MKICFETRRRHGREVVDCESEICRSFDKHQHQIVRQNVWFSFTLICIVLSFHFLEPGGAWVIRKRRKAQHSRWNLSELIANLVRFMVGRTWESKSCRKPEQRNPSRRSRAKRETTSAGRDRIDFRCDRFHYLEVTNQKRNFSFGWRVKWKFALQRLSLDLFDLWAPACARLSQLLDRIRRGSWSCRSLAGVENLIPIPSAGRVQTDLRNPKASTNDSARNYWLHMLHLTIKANNKRVYLCDRIAAVVRASGSWTWRVEMQFPGETCLMCGEFVWCK